MSTKLRVYWFDGDGAAHRLPTSTYERLWEGRESKREFAGRTIPIAEVSLLVEGRTVKAVRGVRPHKLRFRPNGTIDAKHRDTAGRLATDAAFGDETAQERLAKEFSFALTSTQQSALRKAIRSRARRGYSP